MAQQTRTMGGKSLYIYPDRVGELKVLRGVFDVVLLSFHAMVEIPVLLSYFSLLISLLARINKYTFFLLPSQNLPITKPQPDSFKYAFYYISYVVYNNNNTNNTHFKYISFVIHAP